MSKSTDEPPLPEEEIPPLVMGTLVFNEDIVRSVVFDEETSTAHFHPRHNVLPVEQPRRRRVTPLEVESHARTSHKAVWRYMLGGALLILMGLSFLVRMANHFSSLSPSSKPVSMKELCSISSLALAWQPTMVVNIGHLNLVSMNNESVVGMQGQSIMQTHSLFTDDIKIQYMDTHVQSLTLTHNGVLVSRQNDHIVMLSNNDHGMWQSTQDYATDAEKFDSNGKCLVLWSLDEIYVFDQQSSAHIAALEDVTSIKMTDNGIHIFVATDEEVHCFKKEKGRWIAQKSIWRRMDHASDGRKVQEVFDKIHTELDVSSDGSLVALCDSTGQVFFFSLFRRRTKKLGGGGKINATRISVSSNGRRAAVALKSGRVLIYERKDDYLNVVGEILSPNVTLMNFQENWLQIVDGENMTLYENKCDSILKD